MAELYGANIATLYGAIDHSCPERQISLLLSFSEFVRI
jgi:hypothetical protein